MDWIHPWLGLDWIRLDWFGIFREFYGLYWIGLCVWVTFTPFLISITVTVAAQLLLRLSNYDL